MNNFQDKANFIWSVADKLRHDYKPYEYQKVILPLTVIRRLDHVLVPSKDNVFKACEKVKNAKVKNFEPRSTGRRGIASFGR